MWERRLTNGRILSTEMNLSLKKIEQRLRERLDSGMCMRTRAAILGSNMLVWHKTRGKYMYYTLASYLNSHSVVYQVQGYLKPEA